MTNANNKRIAKNTLLLYSRMMLTMGVSLYTVRVVLDTLGTVDYGLYNVIGGIVLMLSFLSGAMASASQRFFSYELGCENKRRLKKMFSMTMTIYGLIAVLILILAETVGVWFLNSQMTIPIVRMEAAHWVYQFSIFSFMMKMFTIPYNAVIIAHENMKVYAWMSIIEVSLKLIVVYLLFLFSFDKLKLYAVLIFGVIIVEAFIYRTYCKRKFEECNYTFFWDPQLFKEIASYSGWNLFGTIAGIFNGQGVNIILNIFFGPIVNAARGIAYQVNSAINQFVRNFMNAARPQITKYYATDEKQKMLTLVFQSSKFSFLLLFILSMPVLLETKFIFKLWLKEVPESVILFTRLIVVGAMIDSLSYALMAAAQATGQIKKYQIIVGGILVLNLPVAYLFLNMGYPPEVTFYVMLANSCLCLFVRLKLLENMVGLPIVDYFNKVILPLIKIIIIGCFFSFLLINQLDEGILRFILLTILGTFTSCILIYWLGLSKGEQNYVINLIDILTKKMSANKNYND